MHAEDNGLAVDFTVTTPGQTPDPAISRGHGPHRARGAGTDTRRQGAAGADKAAGSPRAAFVVKQGQGGPPGGQTAPGSRTRAGRRGWPQQAAQPR